MSETVGINVVFTDLVGSTEMSSRLGPEATEALRLVHFGLLRGAAELHAGTEVKNLGDGLMIVFPSLGSALDGAVAMQQAIERHNASGKELLGVRVGLSTGDATLESDDYFGEPVVEAARLCAKCEAGQIMVSQLTSMLARSTDHTFTSIGDLELRGVPEPVPSMTVDWEPVQISGAVPIPDRLTPDMDLEIAGRVAERATLEQAFKSAEAGDKRLTFLAGEPGIGKTRLSSELAVTAHGRGALTLYGRCDEELGLPYQPWVEAIGYLLEEAGDDLLEEAVRLHGPELSLLVPSVSRRFPDVGAPASTDAETERYRLLQAVTALLSLISEDQPVLLVLDDLHWADKPTLTLLRHVFTNLKSTSLMIVSTYRDSDLETGHPLIDTVAALRRENGVEQLPVTGLDDVEMVSLVQISAGHELDDNAKSMALALRQETAGNPFFAHEILRNLVEVGDLSLGDDGRWVIKKSFDDLALPQSVRDVVGQRIARLGDESLKALRSAAVIGKEFDLELLAEVIGSDEDDLLDLLEAAISAGVVAEVPGRNERFRFMHTVARNTLQGELSEGRRRRMHRKIAEALETSIGADPGSRAGELATHWIAAAAPVEGVKAINYARMAGRQAEAALAPDEAIRWFTTALEHLDLDDEPDQQVRAEILVELGTAELNAGEPEYRQTLLDASALAQRLGDTKLMVDAALANNRGTYSKLGAVDEERIAAIEAALDAIGVEPTAERALLLGTLFSELEYGSTFERRQEITNEAVAIAREIGDDWVLASTLNRTCVTSAAPHTLADRLAASAESLEIAERLGDQALEFWARCGAFQAAIGSGDVATAEAMLGVLTSAADEIGRPSYRWIAACLNCTALGLAGDADALEEQAGATLAVGSDAGEPDAFDFYSAQLMSARWMQGRSAEITDQLLELGEATPEVTGYLAACAMFHAEDGDEELATKLLAEARQRGFDDRVNGTWSLAMSASSGTAALLGDAEAAAVLHERLEPWAGQIVCTQSLATHSISGSLGRLATVLGGFDEAEAHFAASEEVLTAAGARFMICEENLSRAELGRAKGDEEEAKQFADRALETAKEHGYASVERRATSLIESLGNG